MSVPATVPVPAPDLAADGPGLTLQEIFDHIRPHLSRHLVDHPAALHLGAVASRLPAVMSRFWGMEIRLGEPAARADILWEVRRGTRGSSLLAQPGHSAPVDSLCAESAVWAAARRFAGRWRDDGDPASMIGNIWFEADVAGAGSAGEAGAMLARPCLFWGARADLPGSDRRLILHLPGLARDVFGLTLAAGPLSAVLCPLPDGAQIFQLGVMGGRSGCLTRLCLRHLAPGDAENWLTAIGWPGDPARAFAAIGPYLELASSFALDIDLIEGKTGPKLGFELYRIAGEGEADRWPPLFDLLVRTGLSRPEKAAATLAFAGVDEFSTAGLWRKGDRRACPVIRRCIHHVKIVVTPNGISEAKAYLGVYRPAFDFGAAIDGAGGATSWLEP